MVTRTWELAAYPRQRRGYSSNQKNIPPVRWEWSCITYHTHSYRRDYHSATRIDEHELGRGCTVPITPSQVSGCRSPTWRSQWVGSVQSCRNRRDAGCSAPGIGAGWCVYRGERMWISGLYWALPETSQEIVRKTRRSWSRASCCYLVSLLWRDRMRQCCCRFVAFLCVSPSRRHSRKVDCWRRGSIECTSTSNCQRWNWAWRGRW